MLHFYVGSNLWMLARVQMVRHDYFQTCECMFVGVLTPPSSSFTACCPSGRSPAAEEVVPSLVGTTPGSSYLQQSWTGTRWQVPVQILQARRLGVMSPYPKFDRSACRPRSQLSPRMRQSCLELTERLQKNVVADVHAFRMLSGSTQREVSILFGFDSKVFRGLVMSTKLLDSISCSAQLCTNIAVRHHLTNFCAAKNESLLLFPSFTAPRYPADASTTRRTFILAMFLLVLMNLRK